jgi:hypothetical protein
MELLIEDAVEPSFVQSPVRKTAKAAAIPAQPSLLKRLEQSRPGRAVLAGMRWGVVCGLVLSGYFGAEMVSAGIDLASRNATTASSGDAAQPILASADLHPTH